GRRAALRPPRGARRPALRSAGRVGADDEELDRRAGTALLDGAHGDRVRRALLPACGRRGGGRLELDRLGLRLLAVGEALEELLDVPELALHVLAVALEPLDELLTVRESTAAEAAVVVSSTHLYAHLLSVHSR